MNEADQVRIRTRLEVWGWYQAGPTPGPNGYGRQSAHTRIEPPTERPPRRRRGLDGNMYAVMPSDLAMLTPAQGKQTSNGVHMAATDWPNDVIETDSAIARLPRAMLWAVKIKWTKALPNDEARAWEYKKAMGYTKRITRRTYQQRVREAACFLLGAGL